MYFVGSKRMSTVREMPALATVRPERAQVLQERLSAAYDGMFSVLKEQYRIPNEKSVFAFLRQHSQLIPVLHEGRAVVSLIFGLDTPVKLHIQRDPESRLACLIAWIQTDLPASDAVAGLMELNDTWLGERLEVVEELLNFNLGVP
jgi:hypothetical protein